MSGKNRRLSVTAVSAARDEILELIENLVDRMTLIQSQEFLGELVTDVGNILDNVDDTIQSIRADTECTCKERGKTGLHSLKCAKRKR